DASSAGDPPGAEDPASDRALEPEAPTSDGLHVATVTPQSAAEEAGLVAGDRLRSIDGVQVEALADFVPQPGTRRARLQVHRPDHGRTFVTHVTLGEAPAEDAPSVPTAAIVAALIVLAMLLLFVAPTARVTAWLTRVLVHGADEGEGRVTEAGAHAGPESERGRVKAILLRAFEIFVDAAALASIPLCIRGLGGDVNVGVLLLASLAARMIAVLHTQRAGGRSRRVRAAWRFLAGEIPLAAAIGAAVVLSGSVRLGGLVEAQGALPWQWLALRNPLAFVLLPAFVAATVGAPAAGGPPAQATVASAADRVGRLIATTVAVAPFLGGWGPAQWPLWLGVSMFVVKGLVVLGIGARLRRVRRPRIGAVIASSAGAAGSLLWLLADVPSSVESIAGPVLASAALAMAAWLVREMVRARRGARERGADVAVFL
ncbi:MAG: PDZ domain-containing protein, partial [Polyangiales bacterium]